MVQNIEHFGYWAILTNIDWKEESWLIGLLSIHLLIAISLLTFIRTHTNIQKVLFFILLGAAYFSEQINYYAAKNWSLFSKEKYFDSSGLFISVVFSIPILLNCMLIIGLWLYSSAELLCKQKQAQHELKMRRKEASKRQKNE